MPALMQKIFVLWKPQNSAAAEFLDKLANLIMIAGPVQCTVQLTQLSKPNTMFRVSALEQMHEVLLTQCAHLQAASQKRDLFVCVDSFYMNTSMFKVWFNIIFVTPVRELKPVKFLLVAMTLMHVVRTLPTSVDFGFIMLKFVYAVVHFVSFFLHSSVTKK